MNKALLLLFSVLALGGRMSSPDSAPGPPAAQGQSNFTAPRASSTKFVVNFVAAAPSGSISFRGQT